METSGLRCGQVRRLALSVRKTLVTHPHLQAVGTLAILLLELGDLVTQLAEGGGNAGVGLGALVKVELDTDAGALSAGHQWFQGLIQDDLCWTGEA